jgi:hypothetical protein
MAGLGLALVVYAGIAGSGAARVDTQLRALLGDVGIDPVELTDGQRRALARHGDDVRSSILRLHTDGVVVGEVVRRPGHGAVLRVLVYDGAGGRKDFLEMPLDGDTLAAGDLETIRSNVQADFRDALPLPEILPDEPEVVPARPPSIPPPVPIATHEQPAEPPLHVQIGVGFSAIARTFAPGPPALVGYRSGAVPAIGFDVEVEPAGPLSLGAHVEQSLGMSTRIADVDVSTSVARWQLGAALSFRPGATVTLAPTLAIGRRTFTVDSKDPTRSPDGDYTYVGAGLRLGWSAGRVAALAAAAFEPVLGGDEPTMMSLGPARRFGIDAAIAVTVRLSAALFVRAEASAQRFWWSWPDAGTRGAGGAEDTYPGAGGWLGYRY